MKPYTELQAEFDRKVVWLQKHCRHEKTEEVPYMWAPGHYANKVLVCKYCGKIIMHLLDSRALSQ